MAIAPLDFTKDWTVTDPASDEYFPTIEHSEQQVRADIQLLYDEIKVKVNEIITLLSATTPGSSAADNLGATPVSGGTAATVQGILDELNTLIAANTALAHSHSNKTLLDTYTQTESDIASAIADKHTHTNLTALNSITGQKVADYDSLVSVFSYITAVAEDLEDNSLTEIPTVRAVVNGINAASNVFVAVKDETTYSEVEEALASGKLVYALDVEMDGDRVYSAKCYVFSNDIGHVFRFTSMYVSGLPNLDKTSNVYDLWLQDDDTWAAHTTPMATKKYVDDAIAAALASL